MRLSEADVALLGRRAQRPTRAPGELLAVFIARRLKNPKNAGLGWQMKAWGRYKREWREAVGHALLEAGYRKGMIDPRAPKLVTFTATVANALDRDGLLLACSPILDELKVGTVRDPGCGVIDDDRDSAGHEVRYQQVARRAAGTVYGVEIRIRLRAPAATENAVDTPTENSVDSAPC